MYGSLAFVDSVGGGELKLATGNRNVQGGTVDLSALAAAQLTGTGRFWTSGATVLKFPGDMSFADSTAKIDMGSNPIGEQIVVQGVTYTWDGTSWGGQAEIAITGIAVKPDTVEIGVAASTGGTVTILGSETVSGTYGSLATTKIHDGLYSVPVSTARFFKASLDM